MICQFNSEEFDWEIKHGLYHIVNNDKISYKIRNLLTVAKLNSVDFLVFPELSIPEKQIQKIQEWSKEQETIVICGSHYNGVNGKNIPRSPVIIKGEVFFTEKIKLSPLEKSPIANQGATGGNKILKFENSFVGNFGILICSDYLDEEIKQELNLNSLDILVVPAFQRDSEVYFRRMNTDTENSMHGIYILYSNFNDSKYGDGRSAIFGNMDHMYLDKLKNANYTDLNPSKKVFQFTDNSEYIIADLDTKNKRPFANRNLTTEPNICIYPNNIKASNSDLEFIKRIAHDDERYKRIDELYVEPKEFNEIKNILVNKNIIFIIGDPGIGKTYTAVKLLKEYYELGYQPIWIAGLEKEERDLQSKVIRDFEPGSNQIVYFEDPFGRTAFEKRDSLYQIFSPLMDKLTASNCKVIITSRKEIFERFTKESLLEQEVLHLKSELNVTNPSYDIQGLREIFNKLGSIYCEWFDEKDFRNLVYDAIENSKLSTPLSIRDLISVSHSTKSKDILKEQINRRTNDIVKVFALEIMTTSISAKLILYLVYFCGSKGKPFLSQLYQTVSYDLISINLPITKFSFNIDIRTQIGYRIQHFGFLKSAFRFTHPIYEEALANLILSDKTCEIVAKTIFDNLLKLDVKIAYEILNKFVIKSPKVSLLLLNHLLDSQSALLEVTIKTTLAQKLISTYYNTKNEDFFNLACRFYPLEDVIYDINNNFQSWSHLYQKLMLCHRYINNSPIDFDSTITEKINWELILNNKNDEFFTPQKILEFLNVSSAINVNSVTIFIKIKGDNLIQRTYLLLDKNLRKLFLKHLYGQKILRELRKFNFLIDKFEKENNYNKRQLIRAAVFSEKKYYGKIYIDNGAKKAILESWLNLLPAGIVNIIGNFQTGQIVGVFDNEDSLIAVGIAEYSSEDLRKIMKHSSYEFQELIGYFHSSCAIRKEFLKRLNYENQRKKWQFK